MIPRSHGLFAMASTAMPKINVDNVCLAKFWNYQIRWPNSGAKNCTLIQSFPSAYCCNLSYPSCKTETLAKNKIHRCPYEYLYKIKSIGHFILLFTCSLSLHYSTMVTRSDLDLVIRRLFALKAPKAGSIVSKFEMTWRLWSVDSL